MREPQVRGKMHIQKVQVRLYKTTSIATLLMLSLLGNNVFASAQNNADPAAIAARIFLEQQSVNLGEDVKVNIKPLAVRLPHCENPQPFLPKNRQIRPGKISVGIYCGNVNYTARYMQAHISVTGSYIATVTDIKPGTVIHAGLLEMRRGDLSRLPNNTLATIEQAKGKVAKLRLKSGTVLLQRHLSTPTAISRGGTVDIEMTGHGFRVVRRGKALESGSIGDSIRIRLSRKQTLTAVVIARGKVSITP